MSKIKYIKIYKNFFQKCDPIKYIETIQKEADWKGNHTINATVKLEVCVAYIQLHRLDEAKEILDDISSLLNKKSWLLNKELYYSTLFAYYFSIHDIVRAEATFNEMMNFIKNSNLYKHYLIDYASKYKEYFNKLELLKGHYDGMEQYYKSQFNINDCMLNKVNTEFTLGRIYMYCNKTNEAKEAFEYVIQHGNKLYVVQEAKKYLEQLS